MKQIHILVATLVFHAVALASWTAAAGTETSNAWDAVQLKARTDHDNPVSYAIGESIVFSLETTDVPPELDPALFAISWKRTGDDGRTETGRLPFVPGETGSVTTSLDRPGFVRLEARVVRTSDGKPVSRTRDAPGASSWSRDRKAVRFDGGAGVKVDAITPEKKAPKDFDRWWAEQRRLLSTVPPKATLHELPKVKGCRNYAASVACYGPHPVTGYLFVPDGVPPKSCKAIVSFQGYGTKVQVNPKWKSSKDTIWFTINAHGYELGRDKAYYKEFFDGIHPPGWSYAFSPEENAKPETAYFRWMALRVMRALEFVKTLPEWNGRDLVVKGGSQGGLQASWAAGLDHDVTFANVEVVWGCDLYMPSGPRKRLKGSWHIPAAAGLGYFDAINHIRRAKCPVEIGRAGLGDYTCPPSGLAAYYNAIQGPKSIRWVQGADDGVNPQGATQIFTVSSGLRAGGAKSKPMEDTFVGE